MSNGIVMIAFGKQYDCLAAHCVAYSRKFTDLPIFVISNLENRDPKWSEVSDIDFLTLDIGQDRNREIKTTLIDHSPFDKTLYLDCDAIIQRPGIEKIFDLIVPDRILLNIYGRWADSRNVTGVYRRTFTVAGVAAPINIYYGAIFGFTNSIMVRKFFLLYNKYWRESGAGREMPALACAVRNSRIPVREIGKRDGYFSWIRNDKAIIQHEYGKHIRRFVGCHDFRAHKPFDRVRPRRVK